MCLGLVQLHGSCLVIVMMVSAFECLSMCHPAHIYVSQIEQIAAIQIQKSKPKITKVCREK